MWKLLEELPQCFLTFFYVFDEQLVSHSGRKAHRTPWVDETSGFALVQNWLCNTMDKSIISPSFVSTIEIPVDLMTRALPRKVQHFCTMLGLAHCGRIHS